MNKFVFFVLLGLYSGLIFWLSSRPYIPVEMMFSHQDKIHHMGAYFIMAILANYFFKEYISNPTTVMIVSLCYSSLYGLSDEWHQSFVPGRVADYRDWLADTLGALIALSLLHLTKKTSIVENELQ